jgi:hypothetical protein
MTIMYLPSRLFLVSMGPVRASTPPAALVRLDRPVSPFFRTGR